MDYNLKYVFVFVLFDSRNTCCKFTKDMLSKKIASDLPKFTTFFFLTVSTVFLEVFQAEREDPSIG